jgi:hypothetical protein
MSANKELITSDNHGAVAQNELAKTLEDYLTAGMMDEFNNTLAVTLNGSPNRMDPINAVDHTGHVVISDTAPPTVDVQVLAVELLIDLIAVQAAVDGNTGIGPDAQVEQATVDGIGGQAGSSTSAVALPDFTIVVNTSDNDDAVDQAQLTTTL